MFTIEVKKKRKDEEFTFEDLEMFHQECYGGKILTEERGLICLRCGEKSETDQEVIAQIIKTAVDGTKREINKPIKDDDGDILGYRYNVSIIQKTET